MLRPMTTAEPAADAAFVRGAIDRWHAILRGPAGEASGRRLGQALADTRLVFGDRPICRVLRPFFLTEAEAARLTAEGTLLMRAFRKVRKALDAEADVRAALGLTPEEKAILAADRQPFEPDAIARIDGFLVRGGAFKVIEYNAESPGGIAFGDTLAAMFRELPVMEEFLRTHRVSSGDGLGNTLRQLLECHRARVGPAAPAEAPSIAIVDWKSAPTRREFDICAEHFRRHGHAAQVVDPSDLRFEEGRLRAGDFAIDIVYKRVLVKELLQHGGAAHPLARAVKASAVTCASGFGVQLLFRKDLFALLWDGRFAERFDAEERGVIRRCIPWTRRVEDVVFEHEGRPRRLLDVIRERRERLVLKPVADYGGSGVSLGWLMSPEDWAVAVTRALETPSVVQERVELPSEEFPAWHEDRMVFERFYADINPFVWGGRRAEGFGCRLASGELLNVTAGGGSAVPVFVIAPRG